MKKIIELINESLTGVTIAKLYFLLQYNDKEEFIIKQVNLDNEITQPKLSELAKDSLISTFLKNPELSIRNLSESDDRNNFIYKDDWNLLENTLNFFHPISEDIINTKSNKFDNYNIKKDIDKKIFGYVIAIGNSSQQLMYFTKHYAISTFSTEQFILIPKLGINLQENELFTKVDSELVRISKKIDVLYINKELYICNLEMLESFFKFNKFIQSEAKKSIDTIKSINLLENYSKLEKAKDKIPIARKLATASKNSQVLNLLKDKKIEKNDVLNFVKNNSSYFDMKIKDKKLVVETAKEVNSFMKLLMDPLVVSELTKLTYESTNKDLIS